MKLKFKEFKKAYKEAVKNKQVKFKVKNEEFITTFAKYLIEHLNNLNKKDNDSFEFVTLTKDNHCKICNSILKQKELEFYGDTCFKCVKEMGV